MWISIDKIAYAVDIYAYFKFMISQMAYPNIFDLKWDW